MGQEAAAAAVPVDGTSSRAAVPRCAGLGQDLAPDGSPGADGGHVGGCSERGGGVRDVDPPARTPLVDGSAVDGPLVDGPFVDGLAYDGSHAPSQPAGGHRALVDAYYRMVDADDIDGLVALFESDVRYDRPGCQQIVGRVALERFYRAQDPVASRKHFISTCIREGQDVAVHGWAERIALDGRSNTVHFADFFVLSDAGRFAYRRTFFYVPLA